MILFSIEEATPLIEAEGWQRIYPRGLSDFIGTIGYLCVRWGTEYAASAVAMVSRFYPMGGNPRPYWTTSTLMAGGGMSCTSGSPRSALALDSPFVENDNSRWYVMYPSRQYNGNPDSLLLKTQNTVPFEVFISGDRGGKYTSGSDAMAECVRRYDGKTAEEMQINNLELKRQQIEALERQINQKDAFREADELQFIAGRLTQQGKLFDAKLLFIRADEIRRRIQDRLDKGLPVERGVFVSPAELANLQASVLVAAPAKAVAQISVDAPAGTRQIVFGEDV